MRAKRELTNNELIENFMSLFHPGKAQRHKEGVSVLKSEDYITLILLLLGEATFVIGPDGFFVNL